MRTSSTSSESDIASSFELLSISSSNPAIPQLTSSSPSKKTPKKGSERQAQSTRVAQQLTLRLFSVKSSDDGSSDADSSDTETISAVDRISSVVSSSVPTSDIESHSEMSSEDASASIDSFLENPTGFIGDKANKLRLWQALCIELGLVEPANDLPDLPDIPSFSRPVSPTDTDKTPIQTTFDLPQSLTQARKLLKNHAHVNIADYLAERASGTRKFDHLRFESARAMMQYTRKNQRWCKLGRVKGEWLEPLLKDFGGRRSRK